MNRPHVDQVSQLRERQWVPFPGGELEGTPPRALCAECRLRLQRQAQGEKLPSPRALCFQCYRADLERTRAIGRAAELDTASEARFQGALPLEPVNRARLARLRHERTAARAASRAGTGRFVERRVRAQIEARHALARLIAGLRERGGAASHAAPTLPHAAAEPRPAPVHARAARASLAPAAASAGGAALEAGVQYPESWLPFVVAQ